MIFLVIIFLITNMDCFFIKLIFPMKQGTVHISQDALQEGRWGHPIAHIGSHRGGGGHCQAHISQSQGGG